MAVDVAASRTDHEVPSVPGAFARIAAVPAWVWLAGIILASFAGRLFAAVARLTPYYLPDEYIYPSLARSIAEHGRPLIRGVGVHFPALLDPIVTAPVWLVTDDPTTAFRLTQGIHAVLVLARRDSRLPHLPPRSGSHAGSGSPSPRSRSRCRTASTRRRCSPTHSRTRSCSRPSTPASAWSRTRRSEHSSSSSPSRALAVAARIQYVAVPLAVLGAELVADRGRIVQSVRRLWLSLALLTVPPLLLFATLGADRVLGVYANGDRALHPLLLLHWIGREAMLLAYAGGWVIIPGALAGLLITLVRSRNRAELAFAVTTLLLAAALLLEAAQIADTDSQRFQERYLFTLVPLLGAAFGLYVKRGLPWRIPVGLLSAALLLVAARVPLSGYAAAHNKDDSPTLWAVLRLEGLISVGNGALAVALIAAGLSVLAALVAFRKLPAALALVAAIAAGCALSAGASSFDARTSRSLRNTLPTDIRWVDHARLGQRRPARAARRPQGAVVAAAVLEHVRQAAAPPRQPADRPVRRRARARRAGRTSTRGRPPGATPAARPDVRVDAAARERQARPPRADLRPLPPDGHTAPATARRRPLCRQVARARAARSPSGRSRRQR